MLGKVIASVANLFRQVRATTPAMGMLVRITGNAAADPTIVSRYNVASVTRTGVGVYRVTLTQGSIQGVGITSSGVAGIRWNIAVSGATDAYDVVPTVISSTIIDFTVYALTVSGVKINRTAYDLLSTDTVHGSLMVNAGDNSLPEV